ncbi:hypothetical protein PRIPAC_84042 [Pristionchus pacificus]|uniref:Uncharacterized protein n=1 Tax=Pristionchus pacificus TaxID=54126 RepID=A0A2A6BND3_PRIPA|nr:hypothetical protein PRIPAC_84042 [Pristionchus pacificus]|eukprot:PDM67271.1 hypothetical protein PRIPAC_48688 [Pristionchus pacificus]
MLCAGISCHMRPAAKTASLIHSGRSSTGPYTTIVRDMTDPIDPVRAGNEREGEKESEETAHANRSARLAYDN